MLAEPESYVSYKWRFRKNNVEFKRRLCAVYYKLSPTPVKKCIHILIQNFNSAYVHRYNNVCMLSRRSTIPNENILVLQWKYAQPRMTKNKKSKVWNEYEKFKPVSNPFLSYHESWLQLWFIFSKMNIVLLLERYLLSRVVYVSSILERFFSRAQSDKRHLSLCITSTTDVFEWF